MYILFVNVENRDSITALSSITRDQQAFIDRKYFKLRLGTLVTPEIR